MEETPIITEEIENLFIIPGMIDFCFCSKTGVLILRENQCLNLPFEKLLLY
jgi:hypothetical protein